MIDEEIQVRDYLDTKCKEKVLKKLSPNEEILFSDNIKKTSKALWQERSIIITTCSLYNFKKEVLKRSIEISKLKGISTKKNSPEFVIHGGDGEYDYYFKSDKINEIILTLEQVYEKLTGKQLHLSLTDDLKHAVTTKKEKKKQPKASRMNESQLVNIRDYLGMIQKEFNNEIQSDEQDFNRISSFFNAKDYLRRATTEDFIFIRQIGKGRLGSVYLANNHIEDKIVAIKCYEKHLVIENDFISNLLTERDTMRYIRFQLIANLISVFQTTERLYYVYPYYAGGDLYYYLSRNKDKIPHETIVFIAAQVGIAISYLHEKNIIYRNIKLENILIDEKGHIKLVDFSKIKVLEYENDVGTSLLGTSEYLSPEMLKGDCHDKTVDWWSLGVLIYELYTGTTPFQSEDKERIYELIMYCDIENKIDTDQRFTPATKLFLKDLLEKDCYSRLGAMKDFEELKYHKYFEGIDWNLIASESYKSPIVLCSETHEKYNTINFDPEIVSSNIDLHPYIDGISLDKIKHYQKEFDVLTQICSTSMSLNN